LSEANELTPTGTNAPKRGPGRPRKNPETEINLLKKELATLRNERAELQAAKREPTLAPIPPASEERHPGTYVQVGIDASEAPIMGKVRWTKEWIARTYPAAVFTPDRSITISPHGVSYHLGAGIEVSVPQIVKDIYDDVRKAERDHTIRYRTLSATEDGELAARANEMPGTKQWSRLYRAGYGLQVRPPEGNTPVEAEQPAK
jgi:hypothetical protein